MISQARRGEDPRGQNYGAREDQHGFQLDQPHLLRYRNRRLWNAIHAKGESASSQCFVPKPPFLPLVGLIPYILLSCSFYIFPSASPTSPCSAAMAVHFLAHISSLFLLILDPLIGGTWAFLPAPSLPLESTTGLSVGRPCTVVWVARRSHLRPPRFLPLTLEGANLPLFETNYLELLLTKPPVLNEKLSV